MHKQEPIAETNRNLQKFGYRYMGTKGWNLIFEHQTKLMEEGQEILSE